jgi:hypothetical protein
MIYLKNDDSYVGGATWYFDRGGYNITEIASMRT